MVITDIDARFLDMPSLSNIEVWRHNNVAHTLADGAVDFVRARPVLLHLPEREKVPERPVTAPKPGGGLGDEEFESIPMQPDPSVSRGEVLSETCATTALLKSARRHAYYSCGRACLRARAFGEQASNSFAQT